MQGRVRRLEADGVIRGYTALIDPDSVGLPLAAMMAITPLDPFRPQPPRRSSGTSVRLTTEE